MKYPKLDIKTLHLRAYADANIFARLGMDDSFFNDEVNDVVKNRVDGYTRRDDGSYAIYMTI